MSSILVVYASSNGLTKQIADRIAQRLRDAGHHADVCDALAEPMRAAGHDAVVLGSRIQFGKHHPAILRYIDRNREALAERPTAFFSVSMAAATSRDADPNGYLGKLFHDTNWNPSRAIAFGGEIAYTRYNFILRFVMKQIAKKAGHATDTSRDHHYTDWKAVDAFAAELADHFATRRMASTGTSP